MGQELESVLASRIPWQEAYAAIEKVARVYLDNLPEGKCVSTSELEATIYSAQGSYDRLIQKRVFQGLRALAAHSMSAYVTKVPGKLAGKGINRNVWHRAKIIEQKICPTCGQTIHV